MVVVVAGNEDGLVAHYRLAGGQRRRELRHDRQAQGGRGQGQFDQVAGGDHGRQLAALVGRDDAAQAFDQRDKDRARVLRVGQRRARLQAREDAVLGPEMQVREDDVADIRAHDWCLLGESDGWRKSTPPSVQEVDDALCGEQGAHEAEHDHEDHAVVSREPVL